MRITRQRIVAGALAAWLLLWPALPAAAKRTDLKPGFNLFSPQQDVELGREAAAEAEKQLPLLRDADVNAYLNRLGQRLAREAPGHEYPYQFKGINDGTINAFALPGGFLYINRGTIEAADNEAQLAGVMAHEIAHVALRHGTNQLSKAVLLRAPLAVAGGLLGGSGSLAGQLAQLGLAVGFTAVFLKYSRSAETQADVLATQILYDSGYEPKEMALFFDKMAQRSGGGGGVEFFSSHPNPKNRGKRVDEEIDKLGKKSGLRRDSDDFHAVQSHLAGMPPPPKQGERQTSEPSKRPARPSENFQSFDGSDFRLAYPDNWQSYEQGPGVVLAPPEGIVATGAGGAIGYGVIVNLMELDDPGATLDEATERLLHSIRQSNPAMRELKRQRIRPRWGGRALSIELVGESPYPGEHELDWLVTSKHRDRLFYLVFVAPEKEFSNYEPTFRRILDSTRLR